MRPRARSESVPAAWASTPQKPGSATRSAARQASATAKSARGRPPLLFHKPSRMSCCRCRCVNNTAGRLSFNPITDSLVGADGKTFKLEAPKTAP